MKVEKNPYQLIFSNPGTIRLGKKQMFHGGKSSPRNKVIMNMFNFIGVGERAGSGVPIVYKIWEEENYEEPTVDELSGCFSQGWDCRAYRLKEIGLLESNQFLKKVKGLLLVD